MRFRIQTCPPLPEVKIWFIPEDKEILVTVHDLKDAICRRIPAVNESRLLGHDLGLFLDDFELLDDSPFSAVRDGDTLCVKVASVQAVKVKAEGLLEVVRAQKRKRSPTSVAPVRIPGRSVRVPTVAPKHKERISSDSDSDSESSDSSSSSTSSSSSRSSSSSSSTTSSSSSSSPPAPRTSKLPIASPKVSAKLPDVTTNLLNVAAKLPNTTVATSSKIQNTPPGQGKSETHARNLRRRYKQQAARAQNQLPKTLSEPPAPPPPPAPQQQRPMSLQPPTILQPLSPPQQLSSSPALPPPAPPRGSSAPNLVPLGRKKIVTRRDRAGPADDVAFALNNAFGSNATTGELGPGIDLVTDDMDVDDEPKPQQQPLMMLSLKNKNKKKGFKQSMAAPIPKKIVFAQAEDIQIVNDEAPPQPEYVRLVPPSDLQSRGELPPNMFVTSVDVEQGIWNVVKEPRKPKNSKKKKTRDATWADRWFEEPQVQGKVSPLVFAEEHQEVTDTWKEEEVVEEVVVSGSTAFDWDRAEKVWETSFEVKTPDQLAVGGLVGWKDLGLNLQTFSPEYLLFVAKIIQIEGTRYTIKQLQRPGSGTFGFGDMEEGEVEEEVADEVLEWERIVSKWRVIPLVA